MWFVSGELLHLLVIRPMGDMGAHQVNSVNLCTDKKNIQMKS